MLTFAAHEYSEQGYDFSREGVSGIYLSIAGEQLPPHAYLFGLYH
jgi:hypothetical protein